MFIPSGSADALVRDSMKLIHEMELLNTPPYQAKFKEYLSMYQSLVKDIRNLHSAWVKYHSPYDKNKNQLRDKFLALFNKEENAMPVDELNNFITENREDLKNALAARGKDFKAIWQLAIAFFDKYKMLPFTFRTMLKAEYSAEPALRELALSLLKTAHIDRKLPLSSSIATGQGLCETSLLFNRAFTDIGAGTGLLAHVSSPSAYFLKVRECKSNIEMLHQASENSSEGKCIIM